MNYSYIKKPPQKNKFLCVLTDRVHLYRHQTCCHRYRTLATEASPYREKKRVSVVVIPRVQRHCSGCLTFPTGGRRWSAAAGPWRAAEGRRCWAASAAPLAGCCCARHWSAEVGSSWSAAAQERMSEPHQATAARPEGTQARPAQGRHLQVKHNWGQIVNFTTWIQTVLFWSIYTVAPVLHVVIK